MKLRPLSTDDSASGELCVRGPMTVAEYTDPDGWCASGDIMSVDGEGYLFYQGRVDRMINNGFHVYPEEIERAIGTVDGIDRARVYGKPDPSYGEIVVADLVLGKDFEQDEVLSRIRGSLETILAKYKVPRVFNFVDSIET